MPEIARTRSDRPELPSGFITFMFTDVEGSTQLLRSTGRRYAELLATHNAIIRAAVSAHHGFEVRTEGDSFFCVFTDAVQALAACLDAQRALCAQEWPAGAELKVRIGLHTGEAVQVEGDYLGLAVHQAARVVDAGHGQQVLVSEATRLAVGETLPEHSSLERLGAYRLKDFPAPTPLYQLRHPELPAAFPALRTLPAAAHNVPEQATLFVDRRAEVIELAELTVARRLVSVVGPGGVGKTRLATELVPSVVGVFADGVWLIELATLGRDDGVAAEVAAAVGVQAEAEREIDESLADALADKQLLLVLDNCEHVLDASARLVHRLIEHCPGVHVLATSREPLGLREENRFSLLPLSVPASADAVGGRRRRRGGAVRGPRTGRDEDVRSAPGASGRRRDLPPARRSAARDRARGGADGVDSGRPHRRSARSALLARPAVLPRPCATAPRDPERIDRVEPRPARHLREGASQAAVGVRRGLRPRGRRGDRQAGAARRRRGARAAGPPGGEIARAAVG